MSESFEPPDFATAEAIGVELERIIGPEPDGTAHERFFWLLPLSNEREGLSLLREVDSGIGLAGLRQFCLQRFGTVAGLKAEHVQPDDPTSFGETSDRRDGDA